MVESLLVQRYFKMKYKDEIKNCQNCKNDFTIEPDDFSFYEKIKVPPPTFCPECRQNQRILHRNFKTLYKRPSSKSGKTIISMYNPDVVFPVYDISEWWGDDWDPMDYGRDIDWNRSFFEQMKELLDVVPRASIVNTKSENCEYSNMTYGSSNCYLVFGCVNDENCDYGHIIWDSKDCIDNLYILKCENCYECIDCMSCNKVFYSEECENCAESIGLYNCRGCFNCIGCVGLVNKSYCIFNKQVSKEEYEEFLKQNPISNKENIRRILEERNQLKNSLFHRSFSGSYNNNVSGNHIYNAHNVQNSFDVRRGENSKFCFTTMNSINTYDASFSGGTGSTDCYQILFGVGNRIFFSHNVADSHDIYYSNFCYSNNSYLFGCCGLRGKSYCILNKQYTESEYKEILPKLIEHMERYEEFGKFFPKEISPFAYNESIINEYSPLTKQEAIDRGFTWREDIPSTTGQETIKHIDLSKEPSLYIDELKNEVFACEECDKNYRLISREIAFYKRNNISISSLCFNCRHKNRMFKRLPRKLFQRECMCYKENHTEHAGGQKCEVKFETSYAPDRPEIVYCEKCYQQEVY